MGKAQIMLNNLRTLRLEQQERADRAADLFAMAARGMSARRAMDTGGTGECPLSRYGPDYAVAKAAAKTKGEQAAAIWQRIKPHLQGVEYDAYGVMTLYYNHAMDWEDVRTQLKRSEAACQRMHAEMVQRLDGLL